MYFWAREQAGSHNHHYHCLLLLDGRKIQNPYGVMKEAERLWGGVNHCSAAGLVHLSGHRMLRTDSPTYQEDIAACIFAATYLSKANTKGAAPSRVREYGYSHLPTATTRAARHSYPMTTSRSNYGNATSTT